MNYKTTDFYLSCFLTLSNQEIKERVLNLIFDKITWRSDEESLDFIFNPIGISLLKNGGAFEYIG